jgi:hypothetical protein
LGPAPSRISPPRIVFATFAPAVTRYVLATACLLP